MTPTTKARLRGTTVPALNNNAMSASNWYNALKGHSVFKRLFGKRQLQYKCRECGEIHKGSPSISLKFPTYYFDIPEPEREDCVRVNDDLCHIRPAKDDLEGEDIFCIRVTLEIPIKGSDAPFTWGVWVTQSKESFERYVETFGQDQSSLMSFGWLPVDMPFYYLSGAGAPLEYLECDIIWSTKGQRPKAFLWESSHPLSVDQREGISWRKAMTIANLVYCASPRKDHVVDCQQSRQV
jgi:hypothetical protein